jgi:hypothetical protein
LRRLGPQIETWAAKLKTVYVDRSNAAANALMLKSMVFGTPVKRVT